MHLNEVQCPPLQMMHPVGFLVAWQVTWLVKDSTALLPPCGLIPPP